MKFAFALILLSLVGEIFSQNLSYREVEQKILETLLQPPYDVRIRPIDGSNDTGTLVSINMLIRSFDFIDDVNMQYGLQITFRMMWTDSRLRYSNLNPPEKLKYLTLSSSSPIWTPDIFFSNEKSSYIHEMLVPNKFIRVFRNGDVLYSARLTMTLSCPMQLRNFPFDVQTCGIRLASYGYTTTDLIFKWASSAPLQLQQGAKFLELPRFRVEDFSTGSCDSVTLTGNYSCLLMTFGMRRDSNYYNSQIFMPCVMVVVLGWFTFWINRYEVSARIVALLATLLVMATLIGGFNEAVPKVSYTKASDVWTVSCFLFVFVAMFEYILVHYLTNCEVTEAKGKEEDGEESLMKGEGRAGEDGNDGQVELGRNRRSKSTPPDVDKLLQFYEYWTWAWFKKQAIGHQIDLIARFAYPLAFIVFNLSYWPQYLGVN